MDSPTESRTSRPAREAHASRTRHHVGARAFVRIQNISKHFGKVPAVSNVSLDVYENELFCLLGGSGSGKSTLLRMLAGFERPTSGRIVIDGVDMADIPPWKRPVNMMFQSYALFPHLNVEQNVAFGLRRAGVPRAETRRRVADMLELVQLGPLGRRKPSQLSGGQRQRVALARSLVTRPKLLLLDEPLGALDKKLREETQFELINLQHELGITFIVVTHDQEEAMTLASRMAVMNHGEIVQIDEPRQVYEYPNSRFVARFIGSANLFEGIITEEAANHVSIETDQLDAPFYVDHGMDCVPGQQVGVAIRPEKIRLDRHRPDQQTNWAHGSIADMAYMGGLTIYQVRLESGRDLRVTEPNLERKRGGAYACGDEVFLYWQPDSAVVLTR